MAELNTTENRAASYGSNNGQIKVENATMSFNRVSSGSFSGNIKLTGSSTVQAVVDAGKKRKPKPKTYFHDEYDVNTPRASSRPKKKSKKLETAADEKELLRAMRKRPSSKKKDKSAKDSNNKSQKKASTIKDGEKLASSVNAEKERKRTTHSELIQKDPLSRRKKVIAASQRELGKLISRLWKLDHFAIFAQPFQDVKVKEEAANTCEKCGLRDCLCEKMDNQSSTSHYDNSESSISAIKEQASIKTAQKLNEDTKDDIPKIEKNEDENVIFECEFGCGFEHATCSVVEEHEKSCEMNSARAKEFNDTMQRNLELSIAPDTAERIEQAELLYECEFGCGFEDPVCNVVESHEKNCGHKNKSNLHVSRKKGSSSSQKKGNAKKSKKRKMKKSRRQSSSKDGLEHKRKKKKKRESAASDERELEAEIESIEESRRKLIKLLCFDYLYNQYEAGSYYKLMDEEEYEDLQYLLPSNTSFDRNDIQLAMVAWEKFEEHYFTMINEGISRIEKDENPKSRWSSVQRLLLKGREHIENLKEKQKRDMVRDCPILPTLNKVKENLRKEERIDYVERENREPAMARWKKKPFEKREYSYIEGYVPVTGISKKEAHELKLKLLADDSEEKKSNRWILPEGMKDINEMAVDQKLVGEKRKKKAVVDDTNQFHETWKTKVLNEDVMETETWGIDCFTRKNIWLVLESVRPVELRMTPGQINWFIEGMLLPAINAQEADKAYDITLSLDYLAARAKQDLLTQERSNPRRNATHASLISNGKTKMKKYRPGFELLGERIKIFWPLDVAWYCGVITSYDPKRKRKKHQVLYDDGIIEWVDLTSDRFVLPNRNTNIFDKEITPSTILAGVEAILEAKSFMGDHNFAIHPKGHGIVCKTRIRQGEFVGPYCGELYPLWLWEQKEAKEDELRKKSVGKDGRIKLPDFWNMRLERPRNCKKGYDIVYVDAKYRGTFTSRLSHSCNPNCGAMLAVINGHYVVGVRALREINEGEEVTIDYNCVTDSEEEFREAICLCGTHSCRGSFLYMTGAKQYMQIINRRHRIAHRVSMLYEASLGNGQVNESLKENIDYNDIFYCPYAYLENENTERLKRHGLGEHALQGLPTWLLRYASLALRFVEIEQLELPARLYNDEMSKRNSEKGKKNSWNKDGHLTIEQQQIFKTSKANAKGVALQRITNLVVALNRARHRMEIRSEAGFSTEEKFVFGNREASVIGYVVHEMVQQIEQSLRSEALDDVDFAKTGLIDPVIDGEIPRFQIRELIESNSYLGQERMFWIGDRVEAKWCGDDADLYPGWFPATILYVYPDGITFTSASIHRKSKTKQLGPSLHILYDSGEVDRIPISEDCVRRPHPNKIIEHSFSERVPTELSTCEENVKFPGPFTGIFTETHQPPIRPLYPQEIIQALWLDRERSVAHRLLRLLETRCILKIPKWQVNIDSATKLPYWWNIITRETTRAKPSGVEMRRTIEYIPDALRSVRNLIETYAPRKPAEARNLLLKLRDDILKLPTLKQQKNLEMLHQKAADLLTLLGHTYNFFVVTEPAITPVERKKSPISPEGKVLSVRQQSLLAKDSRKLDLEVETEPQKPNSHSSSVVAALLGWFDQKDDELDISSLIGTAILPTIESAFEKSKAVQPYRRNELIAQLSHREKRYEPWSSTIRAAFPNVAPKLVSESLGDAWPPPTPPLQLFGSPVVDAAYYDNVDFTKLSSRLTGELSDLRAKGVLDQLKKPASAKGNSILEKVVKELKNTERESKSFLASDRAFIQPPPPPPLLPRQKEKLMKQEEILKPDDPELILLKEKLSGSGILENKPASAREADSKRLTKEEKQCKKVLMDIINRICNTAKKEERLELSRTRDAWYNFFAEFHALDYRFIDIHNLWENMSPEQKSYWKSWRDDEELAEEEPEEEHFLRGQKCMTPLGEGLILRRSGTRRYLIAIAPNKGMDVKTSWGNGVIGDQTGEVILSWGRLYIRDLVVILEFALCVPTMTFFRECVSRARVYTSSVALRKSQGLFDG